MPRRDMRSGMRREERWRREISREQISVMNGPYCDKCIPPAYSNHPIQQDGKI